MVLSRALSKHRTVVLLCLILVGSLVSITVDLHSSLIIGKIASLISYGFYPLQKGATALQDAAGDAIGALLAVGRLRLENERFRETIDLLQSRVVRTREFQKENERLRELLGFAEKKELRFMPVELIGKDATNWFSMATIDKGSRDGIEKNLCVVTDSGVVGRVLSVELLTARVLLLSDSNSRIGAVVQRTRAQGVVQGPVLHRQQPTRDDQDARFDLGDDAWHGERCYSPAHGWSTEHFCSQFSWPSCVFTGRTTTKRRFL